MNCSIAESLERFQVVIDAAKAANVKVRGYVSTVVGKISILLHICTLKFYSSLDY